MYVCTYMCTCALTIFQLLFQVVRGIVKQLISTDNYQVSLVLMCFDTKYFTNYQKLAKEMDLNYLSLLCDPIRIKYIHSKWHTVE